MLILSGIAHAQTTLELPEYPQEVVVSKLTLPSLGERSNSSQPYRRAAPDLELKLARPMKKLCTFVRGPAFGEVVLLSADKREEKFPRGQKGVRCFENVNAQLFVWVGLSVSGKEAPSGPLDVELAVYDPSVKLDWFAFAAPGGTTLVERYPVFAQQSGLFELLRSEFPSTAAIRRRLFLEAPPELFRGLRHALTAGDVRPEAGTTLPESGEVVLAVSAQGSTTDVVTLDGQYYSLKNDFLGALTSGEARVPKESRRPPSSGPGQLDLHAARVLAKAGVKPAVSWVEEFERHEKCYRAEWDKLDPNGHAHHFVMVSPSGSTQDLDAVVDKKVRTACKSQASDAKLTGLLKQVAAARSTFFAATSKEVSARFAAAP